jgi:hypothetical protein
MKIAGFLASCSISLALLTTAAMAADAVPTGGGRPGETVKFVMHRIGTTRSEACCVADFNNDRKPDIAAGPYLYLAPDFKPQKIRDIPSNVDEKGIGYCNDFSNIALDVDGDGLVDIVSCDWFSKQATWYRNPGKAGGLWKEHLIEQNGNFETAYCWDLLGTGRRDVILPSVQRTVWYELGKRPDGARGFITHVVSEKRMEFGVGVGDVNGDGRPDIIRPNAWFEAPADPRSGRWIEHPLALGGKGGKPTHTPEILVYDVNGDGLADIITSTAHGYGIFWYEQVRQGGEIHWKQHTIDDTWTQAHALVLADIDGDGVPELITGKRFMAHNGHDPEEFAPLGIYYYRLKRGPNPVWTKHVVSFDRGIGAGLNIEVVDLGGDGRLDIVTTGKWGGPVWFENQGP